jgi:hypothetical protein
MTIRPDDPAEMTEAERFREVASILAAGVLRFKRRGTDACLLGTDGFGHRAEPQVNDAEESSPFTEKRLDFPGDQRRPVVEGLTHPSTEKGGRRCT